MDSCRKLSDDLVVSEFAIKQINDAFANSKKRIHITNKELNLNDFKNIEQINEFSFAKPKGLWFATGNEWIDWCSSEMPHWVATNVYEIDVDEEKVLRVQNLDQFHKFEELFLLKPELANNDVSQILARFQSKIDYKKLSNIYSGIEISPYRFERRLESYWYYGWDCASGCIWKKDAVKSIKLVAQYNPKIEKYEFFKG